MQIHSLPKSHKKSQRIGRSGKRGSYSGRGVKGQRSRSGHRIRPAERDLIIRLPKQRGFRNKPKEETTMVFNLDILSTKLKSYSQGKAPVALDLALLKTAGLVKKSFKGYVKVLGTGEIAFPVAVNGIEVSASAREKIMKAGGTVNA